MNKIYNNLNIENLVKTDWFNQFKEYQKEEILEGLEANIDVSIYTKLKYNSCKMREIRERLLKEKKDEEYFKGLKNE